MGIGLTRFNRAICGCGVSRQVQFPPQVWKSICLFQCNNSKSLKFAFTTLIDELSYCNLNQRGYLKVRFTAEQVQADWIFVDSIKHKEYIVDETRSHQVILDLDIIASQCVKSKRHKIDLRKNRASLLGFFIISHRYNCRDRCAQSAYSKHAHTSAVARINLLHAPAEVFRA